MVVSWIDDNMLIGNQVTVTHTKEECLALFNCTDCGPMTKYVGNTITFLEDGTLQLHQKMSVQSLGDKFDNNTSKKVKIPAK